MNKSVIFVIYVISCKPDVMNVFRFPHKSTQAIYHSVHCFINAAILVIMLETVLGDDTGASCLNAKG